MTDPGAILLFNYLTMHLFTLHKGSVMSLKFLKVIVNGINFFFSSFFFFLVPTVSFLARKSAVPREGLEGVGAGRSGEFHVTSSAAIISFLLLVQATHESTLVSFIIICHPFVSNNLYPQPFQQLK